MNRFIVALLLFVGLSLNAQVHDTIAKQDFLKKLDSLGGIDSAANAQMKYNLGVELMNATNYTQAISYFDSATVYDSDFILAYFNKGLCHVKLGDLPAAKNDFANILVNDSTYHLALFQLFLFLK